MSHLFKLNIIMLACLFLGIQKARAGKRIYIISAENTGILNTGGLGHATRDTARALRDKGHQVTVILPYYTSLDDNYGLPIEKVGGKFEIEVGMKNGVLTQKEYFQVNKTKDILTDVDILLFEHLEKEGEMNFFFNNGPQGEKPVYTNFPKEGQSFGAWNKAVHHWLYSQANIQPDALILNDWATGPLAGLIHSSKKVGHGGPTVIGAIHSLAFKGQYESEIFNWINLAPYQYLDEDGMKGFSFYGHMSFLKGLIEYSDMVYAVSEKYAEEIALPKFGGGFEGIINKLRTENRLTGVLNGIDNELWDPARPLPEFQEILDEKFNSEDLRGKAKGKAKIQKYFNLPVRAATPLISMTSRIAQQKGFDYLLGNQENVGALEKLLQKHDLQIIITGDGDENNYQKKLNQLQQKYPKQFTYTNFSQKNERLLTAYADFFLNASWFEPSGLNQFFSMRYGTVPLISNVGGLSDSILDKVSGFHFEIHDNPGGDINIAKTIQSIEVSVGNALEIYREKKAQFLNIQKAAMNADNSWESRIHKVEAIIEYAQNNGPERLLPHLGHYVLSPQQLLERVYRVEREECGDISKSILLSK
jgi:starch synthase